MFLSLESGKNKSFYIANITMDENKYRETYHLVNQLRCVFEKAVISRQCICSLSRRFNLADREGIACTFSEKHAICDQLLTLLRSNASFALQMHDIDGPLPHAKEIKVQVGGLEGLSQAILASESEHKSTIDIASLIQHAESNFGQIESFPYSEIMKSIARFKGRQHRKGKM